MKSRIGFLIAAAIAVYTAYRHIYGTKHIGLPILTSEALSPAARWFGYYVWHMVTATVVVMALGFVWAALRNEAKSAGQLLTVLSMLFAGLALWIGLSAGFDLAKVFPLHAFTVMALAGGFSSLRK